MEVIEKEKTEREGTERETEWEDQGQAQGILFSF